MSQNKNSSNSRERYLNIAIGFLSAVLAVLIFGLVMGFLYPRIETTRAATDPTLVSSVIQLEVLNGCGTPGLATRYTEELREYGFDVVETGNFDHFNVSQSFIISRNGVTENAKRVAQAIGIPLEQIIREESPDFYLDVTLVLGEDFESLKL